MAVSAIGVAVGCADVLEGSVAVRAGAACEVDAGVVVAVWTFAGGVAAGGCVTCGAGAAAGCSVAGWLARLKPRGPPAWACVASSDIAAIRTSLRIETPVISSVRLT